MKNHAVSFLLLSSLAFLTACPATENTPPTTPPVTPPEQPTAAVTKLGTVMLNDYVGPDGIATSNAYAAFAEIAEVPSSDLSGAPFTEFLDTCTVTQDPNVVPPFLVPAPAGVRPGAPLSAGSTISIRSGTSVFTTLERDPETNTYAPASSDILPGLPEGELNIEVPGDTFPASSLTIPNIPLVALTAPATPEGVTPESTFTWEPTTAAAVESGVILMVLQFSETNPEDFIGAFCLADDDGTFAFPEATRAELQAVGFERGRLLEASRLAAVQTFSGDSVLYTLVLRQTGL